MSTANFAAGLGFEPRYSAPEADVLPLDDPAICRGYVKSTKNSMINLFRFR